MLYFSNCYTTMSCEKINMSYTILIAEDDPLQRRMIGNMLTKKLGYEVIIVSNGKEAVDYIKSCNVGSIHAVLLDIGMPVMDGFKALKLIREYRADLPILILTGSDDAATAVRAIKEGATDFITKPPEPMHLDVSIKNAIRISTLSQELSKLKREHSGGIVFSDVVGHDSGLIESVTMGRKAAVSNVPVLVMGETGVGKELFARAIHGESKRVNAPFIALNCGAIPHNLVESTLFGHEKGSFTGATSRTIGKFREAEGGTIFLDEIGELPLDAQVELLRVLQQKEVEPVGAGKSSKIDVRVISATNRDLRQAVTKGTFREDLYFRLNVLPIKVPPLRERKEDILALAEYFIARLASTDGLVNKSLSSDAQFYLRQMDFAGNVRELQNLIHRALVLSERDVIDKIILEQVTEQHLGQSISIERRSTPALHINLKTQSGDFKNMDAIEAEVMQMILSHYDNNITRASDTLGIAKSTFYRKIKET